MSELKEIVGAYYSYTPDSRHAREGLAILRQYSDSPETYFADLFWDSSGRSSGLGWRFSEKELASLEFLFDPEGDEWRLSTVNDPIEDYEPENVQYITSQHGHYKTVWLRVGSEPSNARKLYNLNGEISEAERQLQSAISRLQFLSGQRAILIHETLKSEKQVVSTV